MEASLPGASHGLVALAAHAWTSSISEQKLEESVQSRAALCTPLDRLYGGQHWGREDEALLLMTKGEILSSTEGTEEDSEGIKVVNPS